MKKKFALEQIMSVLKQTEVGNYIRAFEFTVMRQVQIVFRCFRHIRTPPAFSELLLVKTRPHAEFSSEYCRSKKGMHYLPRISDAYVKIIPQRSESSEDLPEGCFPRTWRETSHRPLQSLPLGLRMLNHHHQSVSAPL